MQARNAEVRLNSPDAAPTPRADRDHRRRAILDVAREIFLQEGYAACSMAAIAQRAGGSKGTLYNYFSSKEELFASLVQLEGEAEASGWRIPDSIGSIETRLAEIGRSFLRMISSKRAQALHRLVIAESARFPELGRAFYDNGPGRHIGLLAEILREETKAGRLAATDPAIAACQFLELCKAGVHHKLLWNVGPPPTSEDLARSVGGAVEVFLAAYGPGRR